MTVSISIANRYGRAARALIAAIFGGAASMDVLRVFHSWAYSTEFRSWTSMTLIHTFLVFAFLSFWFGIVPPQISFRSMVARGVGASLIAGLLAILVRPPWGTALIITGQAFITSTVATAMYICMAYQKQPRGARPVA